MTLTLYLFAFLGKRFIPSGRVEQCCLEIIDPLSGWTGLEQNLLGHLQQKQSFSIPLFWELGKKNRYPVQGRCCRTFPWLAPVNLFYSKVDKIKLDQWPYLNNILIDFAESHPVGLFTQFSNSVPAITNYIYFFLQISATLSTRCHARLISTWCLRIGRVGWIAVNLMVVPFFHFSDSSAAPSLLGRLDGCG